MWEGIYVHSLTLPLCPVVWQVVLHYGFKQCQQANLQHFTGLACYGKSYLKSVLHSREAAPMNKATAGLQPPLHCAITWEIHPQLQKKINPLKTQLPFGGDKKTQENKRKKQQQILLPVKERGTAATATKHLSHTLNNNICFCPINCFHMGEAHYTRLYSFQKSAFKVLSLAVPHAQCDASFCLIIRLTLTDLQKLRSQIPWEDAVPEGWEDVLGYRAI